MVKLQMEGTRVDGRDTYICIHTYRDIFVHRERDRYVEVQSPPPSIKPPNPGLCSLKNLFGYVQLELGGPPSPRKSFVWISPELDIGFLEGP